MSGSASNGASAKYYGKYRGLVMNNIDPLMLGRLQVQVLDVTGLIPGTWAMPCVPVAGINMGIFTVPPIGSGVWVEFEHGDPDYPIWTGCFWGLAAEVPVLAERVVIEGADHNDAVMFGPRVADAVARLADRVG